MAFVEAVVAAVAVAALFVPQVMVSGQGKKPTRVSEPEAKVVMHCFRNVH